MITEHDLKILIEEGAARLGCTPGELCKKAGAQFRVYRTLAEGGTCTLETAQRVLNFLRSTAENARVVSE